MFIFFNFTKTSYLFSDDIKEALYFVGFWALRFLLASHLVIYEGKKKTKIKEIV